MKSVLENRWITILSVLAVGFLVWLSVAGFTASDPDYTTEDRVTGAVAAVGAVALAAGLWNLHSGRFELWTAHLLIVPALLLVGMFFWLVVPTVVALVVLYAGIVKGGLQRELAPRPVDMARGAS